MELSQFALLLIAVALVLGYLLHYLQNRPSVPPVLYEGKVFGKNEDVKIPATGGTVNFEDEDHSAYQIQLPRQIRAREITFTSVQPAKVSLPDDVYRILIHLKARDDKGDVETFHPHMTVVAKYNDADLKKAYEGDPKRLVLFNYHAGIWRRLAMPESALNIKERTLTAYLGTFSSGGIGGE